MATQHVVLAIYRLADPSHEPAFTELLRRHLPTLRRLGFATSDPERILRQVDEAGQITFVEIFTWADDATARAHEHPEVAAIWEPMALHVADRNGRPGMEFPHFADWTA